MEIKAKQSTVKAPAETFTGDAWFDVIARGEEPSRIRVNLVRFAPGARNAWHSHAIGQTLHITEGVGLIQSRGGEVVEVHAGLTIYTPPGEWHWHGATDDTFMTHLALSETVPEEEGPAVTWSDHVTDTEYRAAHQALRSENTRSYDSNRQPT